MRERFYKIGEVADMLNIEQHTLRYLENSLKLKIKRDERGDRLYSESDLETFRLVLQLKERGLNTTAIKLALESMQEEKESIDTRLSTLERRPDPMVMEIVSIARKVVEQNQELLEMNRKIEDRMKRLEILVEKRNLEKEKKIEEFLKLWKAEQDSPKSKSWLSRLRGKS